MLTLIWPDFTTSPSTMIVRFGRAIHGLALVVALVFLAFSGVYAAVTPACATAYRDTSNTMSSTEKTFAELDRARMASEERWRKYRAANSERERLEWDKMIPVTEKPAPNPFDKYDVPQSVKPTDGCPGRANYLQSILLIITCALATAVIGRGARYVLSGE